MAMLPLGNELDALLSTLPTALAEPLPAGLIVLALLSVWLDGIASSRSGNAVAIVFSIAGNTLAREIGSPIAHRGSPSPRVIQRSDEFLPDCMLPTWLLETLITRLSKLYLACFSFLWQNSWVEAPFFVQCLVFDTITMP
ncbi:MAG: hypothetical protein U9R21_02805 [Candidatus Thermoplasmatota archaeon]|nr:hypothetical protein [Candidatus Thermoplasmatota archaeon]